MNWFILGALAPLLWGVTNFIDKFTLDKYYKRVRIGTILIFVTGISTLFTPLIYLFTTDLKGFSLEEILILMISGFFYIIALFPYLEALKAKDTSLIVPVFQMIPVINLFFGFLILGEDVTLTQIILGFIIIAGAVGISIDFTKNIRKNNLDHRALFFMALSCLAYSLGNLTYKLGTRDKAFWDTIFWINIGYGIQFIIFFLIKKTRQDFYSVVKQFKMKIVGINLLNVSLDLAAKIIFNFALISAPIYLAAIVNSLQPVFVFLLGAVLTIIAPNFIKEDLSKKALVQKFIFIAIIISAVIALNFSLE